MSLTVGFNSGGAISFNDRPLSVAQASGTAADAVSADDEEGAGTTVSGAQLQPKASAASESSSGDITVETLVKRMKELQKLLEKQQQQLAAAQAATYPNPETKASVVAGLQAQIATTNSALLQVAAALMKAVGNASSGAVVNTTA
ncbi:hypothetical protein ABVN23_18675 [Pseudomonas fluorescens]|jgi:hypothetical protein|uniref:hypothetical protein n=1 Tax=Pseudomonas fluorescens TaxID=294 RepID=UPI003F98A83F